MQDFRDNKKRQLKMATFLDFFLRILLWVILVCDFTFCFIFMVQIFYIIFEVREYPKINQMQNCLLPKVNKSFADIVGHICQIKKKSDRTFSLKRAKEHFFVSGRRN